MVLRALVGLVLLAAGVGCGGGSTPEGPGGRTPDLSDAVAFVADSPYAAALPGCVDSRREPESCSIGTLPPIGMLNSEPSVDTLMERVVVSHAWMGERFRAVLEAQPPALRQVMAALTAIVIDADIRPSFYWSLTGAIYIDPRHLWLTEAERATIGTEQDFRSGFGSDLSFVPFSSYLDGSQLAFPSSGPERDLESRVRALAALLFHEGAHANDFVPPDRVQGLRAGERFLDEVDRLAGSRLSAQLVATRPLSSGLWAGLARVLYFGEDASGEQQSLSAADVGAAFSPDGASDPYGYSTREEDFAMLFEETMLKRYFGFDRRVGFATPPDGEPRSCDDYTIGWGVRSRIAMPSVAPRAQLVAELVLGDPLDELFAGLAPAVPLQEGQSLCIDTTLPPASILRWM